MFGRWSLYLLALLASLAVLWADLTPIDVTVQARGVVRPQGDAVRIIAEVGGRIRRVYVEEGSMVRRGDPLVQLDTHELTLQGRALESRIHFTELRLASLETRLKDAAAIAEKTAAVGLLETDATERAVRAKLEVARARFARTVQLLEQGLIAHQVYEDARSALTQAEAEEKRLSSKSVELEKTQAEARLRELAAESTPLRADLANLYHQLEQTRLEIDRRTIASPAGGQITSLAPVHTGEVLSPGTAIAALAPHSHSLVIESWLPTPARAHVAPGQRVRLQSDAFPADYYDRLDGIVLSISPDTHFKEGIGAYRVLITPAPYSPDLRLGMTFQVHFITRQERLLWLLFQKVRRNFDI